MVSLNVTNNGVALAALRRVNADLNTTQNRIATGYRVNSAKDDATVWATATKMRSDVAMNETTKAGLATAKAQADTGLAALDEIGTLIDEVSKIVKTAGATPSATQLAQVKAYADQITNLVGSAKFEGKNTLVAADTISATISYSNNTAGGTVGFTSAANYVAGTETAKLLAFAVADGDFTGFDIDTVQTELASYASGLSALSKSATGAMNFVDKLADIQNDALSALVDADLERETAKMQALQVRQQLAYQAMSMTNNSAQNVLMLFR
jgi:flagellin